MQWQKYKKYHTRLHRKSTEFGHQVSFDGNSAIPDDIGQTFFTDETSKIKLIDFIA